MSAFVRTLAAAGSVVLTLSLSTPVAPAAVQRDALPPTACTAEPRPVEDVAALVAAATPAVEPTERAAPADVGEDLPSVLPEGEPADPEIVAEVTAAALEFAGCRNVDDGSRRLALMTDRLAAEVVGSEGAGGPDGAASPVPAESLEPVIATVRVRDVRVLPGGRVRAVEVWRGAEDAEAGYLNRETAFHVFARAGARWLLDEVIPLAGEAQDATTDLEGDGKLPPASDNEILGRAPHGFGEVDSAVYAEPTAMGAQFLIEALLMVGFENGDDSEGVGCELFIFERGELSVTASAYCRAEEALVGRAAYLRVQASGPRRESDGTPNQCEDVALLATMIAFACTVELPEPTS